MIGRVLRHPGLIAGQAAGHAVLFGAFYWWLGFAESGSFALLLSLAALLLMAAGVVALARRARQQLAAAGPARPVDGVVAVLLFGAAVAIAYWLVGWVPEFEGFTTQAISMAVRWGTGYLLVVVAWLSLLAATSAGKPVESQPSTAALP